MKRLLEFLLHEGRPYKVRKRSSPISNPIGHNAHFHCFGLLLNWRAFWLGWHYSEHHKRLCINLLPCVTVWWAQPGGQLP